MNRIALAVALGVGIVVGVIFGVWPQLDLKLAALFYDPATHRFIAYEDWVPHVRDAATLLITGLAAPAFFAIVGKLVWPRRRMLIPGRAALFLSVTLAVGPFLVANAILKDHWARMRPTDMVQFGGNEQITAWWDPTGPCPDNCSFIAGEPSAAFWTFAPASLAPPQWRPLAYAGVLLVRRRNGRAPHGRRRAFFQRCGLRRGLHVPGGLGAAWADLPLAADAIDRRSGGTTTRTGGQQTSRGAGEADRA